MLSLGGWVWVGQMRVVLAYSIPPIAMRLRWMGHPGIFSEARVEGKGDLFVVAGVKA
jgi:hypothetical protein